MERVAAELSSLAAVGSSLEEESSPALTSTARTRKKAADSPDELGTSQRQTCSSRSFRPEPVLKSHIVRTNYTPARCASKYTSPNSTRCGSSAPSERNFAPRYCTSVALAP